MKFKPYWKPIFKNIAIYFIVIILNIYFGLKLYDPSSNQDIFFASINLAMIFYFLYKTWRLILYQRTEISLYEKKIKFTITEFKKIKIAIFKLKFVIIKKDEVLWEEITKANMYENIHPATKDHGWERTEHFLVLMKNEEIIFAFFISNLKLEDEIQLIKAINEKIKIGVMRQR